MSIAVVIAVAGLAGCSGGSSGPRSQLPSPVSTQAPGSRALCGLVSPASIRLALGRSDFTSSGSVKRAAHANADGTDFASASCDVRVPGDGESPAFSVEVIPFTPMSGSGILRTARIKNDLTGSVHYSPDVGEGFAAPDLYQDAAGRSYTSCDSGLVRGDWVITLGITVPGPGRDAVADTIALAQQIVNQLAIPLKPTTPYPDPFTGRSTASPAPSRSH